MSVDALLARRDALQKQLDELPARICEIRSEMHEIQLEIHRLTNSYADNTLTTRQRQVLDLVLQELQNKEIADKMNISLHTVKFHVHCIFDKFGMVGRTRWELIRKCRLVA